MASAGAKSCYNTLLMVKQYLLMDLQEQWLLCSKWLVVYTAITKLNGYRGDIGSTQNQS